MKPLLRLAASLACLAACSAALVFAWPNARDAAAIFLSQDDPAVLSELQIRKAVAGDPQLVEREITAALTEGDVDLAQSFAHRRDLFREGEGFEIRKFLHNSFSEGRHNSSLRE